MKKKVSLILALIMVLGVLGGCGASFDASSYLKALLDNMYKNDSSQLVSMKVATAEEASEVYEEGLDSVIDGMLESVGTISEEQKAEIRAVFADVLAAAKYTVGEAEKKDDYYIVTVSCEQMNIYKPTAEAWMAAIVAQSAEWQAAMDNGEEVPSDEEQIEWLMSSFKDCIAESLKNATYDEAQTVTVKISIKDNLWTPSTSDLNNVENSLFDYEEANSVIQ